MNYKNILASILAIFLSACASVPHIIYPPLPPQKSLVKEQPTLALVLGGGGARGFAHLGVLKALEEAHIPIDLIVGTSAGSLMGGIYAANPHIDAITHTLMRSSYGDFLDFSFSGATCGPIPGKQFQGYIDACTKGKRFEDLKIPFIAVAADLNTGKTIAIQNGSVSIAIHSSCAIPMLVRPVEFKNATLVDGGLTDPIPVDIAHRFHPKIIIAVNICSDIDKHFKLSASNIICQSLDLMTCRLTQYTLKGADIIIRPCVGTVSIFDLSKKQQLYKAGLIAGRKAIPEIKRLLAQVT